MGPSPDVADVFPTFEAAARCRFRLVLSVEPERLNRSFLAILHPVFERGVGRTWSIGNRLQSPPQEFVARVGGGADVGLEFLDYFLDFAKLSEDDTVLDFGCGTGRMAIPLQMFLSETGRYVGIDVDQRLIAWCKENIQEKDGRFEFLHVQARNDLYNPDGRLDVTEMALPVRTGSTSFAFATSVFTHLRAEHSEHYLRELGRVLRPGGRLLMTAFVVDAALENEDRGPTSELTFEKLDSETWTTDPALPERAIGFRLETLNRWASSGGMTLVRILPGTWVGGAEGHSYQDILVYSKNTVIIRADGAARIEND